MLNFFQFLFKKYKKYVSSESGFTLVEIIIAFFLIAIITAIVIHSSIMAVNTSKYNKTKTIAISIANEEMEKIRAMDYENIGLVGGTPEGSLENEIINSEGYTINYNVSWVDGEENYKQVSVSVFKEPMQEEIEVITQIYPSGSDSSTGSTDAYPTPSNLSIADDDWDGTTRTIVLAWSAPETDLIIVEYKVYRDGSLIGSSDDLSYIDNPGGTASYNYYVSVVYDDGTESGPSNSVASTEIARYPGNIKIASFSARLNAKKIM